MNPAGPPTEPPSVSAAPPAAAGPLAASAVLRRDLLSAYAAGGAKVLSWVIVSAIVFRVSPAHFAVLALVRGTLALLNYTTVGLTPALLRMLATARRAAAAPTSPVTPARTLDYGRPPSAELRAVYCNGIAIAVAAGCVGQGLAWLYAAVVDVVHDIPDEVNMVPALAAYLGAGIVLRLVSDAPAAVIQTAGRIALDNALVATAEAVWVLVVVVGFWLITREPDFILVFVASGYCLSGVLLLCARACCASYAVPLTWRDFGRVDRVTLRRLLAFGSVVAAAQLADFLYAPVDYILINRLIDPQAVAAYAPLVQVNGGLLLLASGVSAVVLPRAAVAHAGGDADALRRYYVRGTVAAFAVLAPAALAAWALSPWVFRLWLGDPLPAAQALLPLVLVHTIVGGSGGVGRAVLLAAGNAKAYAAAVWVAGVAHVALTYAFVRYTGWGLQGIAVATVIGATGLSAVWQPWYVMRTLRRMREGRVPEMGETSASAEAATRGAPAGPAAPLAPPGPGASAGPVEPL